MDSISQNERIVLEILVQANGQLGLPAVLKSVRQRMGLSGGRTRGITELVAGCLKSLQAKAYATVGGAAHRRPPRSFKEHHTEEQRSLLAMTSSVGTSARWQSKKSRRMMSWSVEPGFRSSEFFLDSHAAMSWHSSRCFFPRIGVRQ